MTNAQFGLSVYGSAIAGTHCAYPGRDSQAELTWMAKVKLHLQRKIFQFVFQKNMRDKSLCLENVKSPSHHSWCSAS